MQIYDVGEVEGRPYFTMELVEGGSLAQKIENAATPYDPGQSAELVATLARGMHVAHQAGIVHRDLKPGNILLSPDGVPKISDFGLASRFDGECSLTGTEARLGTPNYMSPEQATGGSQTNSPPVDVYALGAILYELLSGEPPFRAKTALETQRKVVLNEAMRPSRINHKLPRDLDTICLKCLNKDPANRYTSAADLADDLDRFLRLEPINARPAGLVERTRKWVRRKTAIAVCAALGVALVALGVCNIYWSQSQRARVASDIEAELRDVSAMESAGRWSNADAALRRAQARLDVRSSVELRQRVNDARQNLAVASSLDAVRLDRATAGRSAALSTPRGRRLRGDFSRFPARRNRKRHPDIAATVKTSPIRNALLAAMDDWACTTSDPARRQWILDVVRLADDPDPQRWRERIRDSSQWADLATVRELSTAVPPAMSRCRRC